VLFGDATRRGRAGPPPAESRRDRAAPARRAFDLLEPSLTGYGVKA
jgi:hypothetical protein